MTASNARNGQTAYLRALRDAQGLTQEGLAEMIGTIGNTISKIELGKQVSQRILIKLLGVLHGTVDDWLDLEGASADEGMRRANERIDRLRLLRKMTPAQIEKLRRRRGNS